MSKKKNSEPEPQIPYTGKAFLFVAIGLEVFGAVSLGLIFTVLGIYALIASVIFGLAALAFCNTQKKKNPVPALKYVIILGYVLTAAAALIFIGGIIWSSLK